MFNWLKNFLIKLAHKESSPKRLAQSFCLGVYIALSPFLGLHTIMIFALSWIFRLNAAVTFTTAYILNNPWTMIPIFTADYFVGHWLFNDMLHIDMCQYNPSWMGWLNEKLHEYLSMSDICLWSFIIGGNILAIAVAITLYPSMLKLFARLVKQNPPAQTP